MEINYNILVEYEGITSFNMAAYFQFALEFINSDYQTIVSYYSGIIDKISSDPFNNLKIIKQQRDAAFESFNSHKQKLTNLKWFLLIEKIEDIDSRLHTLDNINKWSRSSLTNVGYDPSFSFGYTLKQKQTLEGVSQNVLGDVNPEDDWFKIAIDNDITEEDYSPDGGTQMTLKVNRSSGFNFQINSVVDIVQGKSVLGKDLDNKFGFDSVNNDLKVLSPDDTIMQAAYNLIKLKKNDVSSARALGLQSSMVVGSNRALLNFPVIVRQLSTTFASDDTFKEFTVNKMSTEQDNVTVEWQVKSRLGEIIANETTVV